MSDLLGAAEGKFGECLGVSGDEARFLCPYHDDDTGKLYLNVVSGKWICFSGHCGAKGRIGYESTDDELEGLRKRLARLERGDDPNTVKVLPEAYLRQYTEHPYWLTRGFNRKTVKSFGLGFDPLSNRLTIPVRAVDGSLLGVITRSLDGSRPKYLHPKGFKTGKHLFCSHLAKGYEKVALVEGPLDAVACWDARVPAVACYGARVTEGQLWLLRWLGVTTVVPFFDRDRAGAAAADHLRNADTGLLVLDGSWGATWRGKDPGELKPYQRRAFYHGARHALVTGT